MSFNQRAHKHSPLLRSIALRYLTLGVLSLVLVACNDTSSSPSLSNNGGSIIDGSGAPVPDIATAVTGSISGFGSVFVDGVRYTTDNTEVYIDGKLKAEADLNVGDFITLLAFAENENGESAAQTIYAESAVRGEITKIDRVTGELTVVGQKVVINEETFYGDSAAAIDTFTVGDMIDIHGPSDNRGSVVATRIYPNFNGHSSLRGVISALNVDDSQFVLAGVTVSFGAASELPSELNNALPVVVKGRFDSTQQRFMAESIRKRNDVIDRFPGIQVRTEGIAHNVIQDDVETSFVLGSQRVQVTEQTTFIVNGSTAPSFDDVTAGAYLIVVGEIDDGGQLVANRVTVKPIITEMVRAKVSGIISDITITNKATVKAAAMGELLIADELIIIDNNTRLIALGVSQIESRIQLEDLGVGDKVTARGIREYQSPLLLKGGVNSGDTLLGHAPVDDSFSQGPIFAHVIEVLRGDEHEQPVKDDPRQPEKEPITPVKDKDWLTGGEPDNDAAPFKEPPSSP